MIELGKAKRQVIESICRESSEVLILGAMEGSIGRVWVPKLDIPSFCLIQVGDFSYLIGIPPKGSFALDLKVLMYEVCEKNMITTTDERWEDWIEEQFIGEYRKITRYALKKDENRFDQEKLQAYKNMLPSGFRLKKMDGSSYRMALKEKWSQDFCNNFEDEQHFLSDGLGYVIMKGRKMVAGCSAYGVSSQKMEVEVATLKEFRRQGLALVCSAAFVSECISRGIYPNWDAANLRSVALAEKLGYIYDKEYEVYQLQVNTDD